MAILLLQRLILALLTRRTRSHVFLGNACTWKKKHRFDGAQEKGGWKKTWDDISVWLLNQCVCVHGYMRPLVRVFASIFCVSVLCERWIVRHTPTQCYMQLESISKYYFVCVLVQYETKYFYKEGIMRLWEVTVSIWNEAPWTKEGSFPHNNG